VFLRASGLRGSLEISFLYFNQTQVRTSPHETSETRAEWGGIREDSCMLHARSV
jgi:hypothetical protein